MKIFFTASRYELPSVVDKNYQRAKSILNREITYLSVTGNVFQTFNLLQSLSYSSPFIWIDGDNWLYEDAISIFEQTPSAIMMTENEYGIVYGHGGIKFCKNDIQLSDNLNSIDCSKHSNYKPVNIIGSFHDLGHDWVKIRTIFVEMCKLSLRGKLGTYYLSQWQTARPDIWMCVHSFLTESNCIRDVKKLINDREVFKQYYDTKLRGYL